MKELNYIKATNLKHMVWLIRLLSPAYSILSYNLITILVINKKIFFLLKSVYFVSLFLFSFLTILLCFLIDLYDDFPTPYYSYNQHLIVIIKKSSKKFINEIIIFFFCFSYQFSFSFYYSRANISKITTKIRIQENNWNKLRFKINRCESD